MYLGAWPQAGAGSATGCGIGSFLLFIFIDFSVLRDLYKKCVTEACTYTEREVRICLFFSETFCRHMRQHYDKINCSMWPWEHAVHFWHDCLLRKWNELHFRRNVNELQMWILLSQRHLIRVWSQHISSFLYQIKNEEFCSSHYPGISLEKSLP